MNAIARPAAGVARKRPSKALKPVQSQGDKELAAMKVHIARVTSSKRDAVKFLKGAGIIDGKGNLAKQYRS